MGDGVNIQVFPHYKVISMDAEYNESGIRIGEESSNEKRWNSLKQIFKNGVNEYNWIIGTTGTVHGISSSLDEIEENWNIVDEENENYYGRYFTYLIIHPRLCCLKYGTVRMRDLDDIKWIRQLIRNTIYCMDKSQQYNTKDIQRKQSED